MGHHYLLLGMVVHGRCEWLVYTVSPAAGFTTAGTGTATSASNTTVSDGLLAGGLPP